MKRSNKLPCLFAAIFLPLALWAQEDGFKASSDPTGISDRISTVNEDIRSLHCDFEQIKALSFLEEIVNSSGKFYFERKDKIRWEYEKPYSYIIIMNGSMIRIEDQGRANTLDASSNRLFNSINSVMSGIIDGSVIQREDQFKATFFENDSHYRIRLEPVIEGMKEFIGSILMDLDKKDCSVDTLKIIEKNGDYTLILFKNKEFNASLSKGLFDIP